MSKAEELLDRRIARDRLKLRKLKAERRLIQKKEQLLSDARLGAYLRKEHKELAHLLTAAMLITSDDDITDACGGEHPKP